MVTEVNEPRAFSPQTATASNALSGFFKRLAQYYAEFLSTDFKKQRLPRRRLENSDAKGRLVGIPLRKYPGFQQKMWETLAHAIGTGLEQTVSRGGWSAVLPKAVMEAISAHIAQVDEFQIGGVIEGVMMQAFKLADQKGDDPDIAFEKFTEATRSAVAREIIAPLLNRMEGFFARTENKPVESLRELEDELSVRLTNGVETASGAAFSTLLVEGDPGPILAILRDQLALDVIRDELTDFFTSFTAADLYVELSDLVRSSRLIENVEFYLHIGEIHHAGQVYPIFYIPFTAVRGERSFKLESEPRIYVNKKAMDYVAQQVAKAEGRPTIPSVVRDRIIYLEPDQSALNVAQAILDNMVGGFNLREEIDFRQPRDQKISSLFVTATNRLSFSLFDRADESMVNDYESILTGLNSSGDITQFFKGLIDGFLLQNPVSVREEIDREWDEKPMPQRLVFDSPLPLVEEQRKILSAIRNPRSRFIAVEGPPGTGKSHTITAVAFQTILAGKSVLVLSDKKEALDVVESKLNEALAKVRPTKDFPNSILRLGKDVSNYARLISRSAIERVQVINRTGRSGRKEREEALAQEKKSLHIGLENTAKAYNRIDLTEIAKIEREIADFAKKSPGIGAALEDPYLASIVHDFGLVAEYVRSIPLLITVLRWRGSHPARLVELSRINRALATLTFGRPEIQPIIRFTIEQFDALTSAIEIIEHAKRPVFGYVFSGKKLNEALRVLREDCKFAVEKPHKELLQLKSLHERLLEIQQRLKKAGLDSEFETAVVLVATKLAGLGAPPLAPPEVLEAARRLNDELALSTPLLEPSKDNFYPAFLASDASSLSVIDRLAALKRREDRVRAMFKAVPEIDYLGAKTRIESLNTQLLAERIDERLIEFYDTKKNDALALGRIIREKQRFPVEQFADIQRAFPCIIAGLRDYAEYIPLKRELFDLVIIDEASQVSIAQAIPAILRAKKLLVLGDRNQFGNVKTTNASHEVNTAYMQDLIKTFSTEFPNSGSLVRTKIDLFDIRRSVLDFVEHISNFSIQLKKHFRSFPEMISFSSKYFYQDSLQVMRIRGVQIDEVLEFDAVKHDGLLDQRNVNDPEARRILERILEYIDVDLPPTIGVITPHTEQQAYITKLIHEHARSEDIYDRLKLKVMTFDTCQGEERQIIFYSLVATTEKDRLAYIFPKTLGRDDPDVIDHNLRRQRLNVGFSRGQDRIVFVHSKPVDQYSSAVRVALFHYQTELRRAKEMPSENDVDSNSPMELKVLHWLSQVPLLRELDGLYEIKPQFELGKYLKQLDPTYSHPAYRVDFLIRISDGKDSHQIAIEYDGFEYHFSQEVPASQINESTWKSYLTADDLEREKVLESFGVQMIRLNRFNLGENPVQTIDAFLRKRLIGMLNGRKPHDLVSEVAAKAGDVEKGLKSGEFKRCKKCDRDLPIEMFKSRFAKSGYGHQCKECRMGFRHIS